MCFGSKSNNTNTNDPAPKPVQIQPSNNNSTAKPRANMPQDYSPPPGPPPSHHGQPQSSSDYYAPPPGPPPTHAYAPPTSSAAAPLPTKNNPFFNTPQNTTNYAPPPGPPPTHASSNRQSQDKKHDWETAVPDTALLPPPPNFFSGFDRSPAHNATEEECEAGEAWCATYPIYGPMSLNAAAETAARGGNIALYAPAFFGGSLTRVGPGVWRGASPRGGRDASLASYPPLYHAAAHSPLVTGRKKTAYYEVKILEQGDRRKKEVSLALGFAAPPYPGFRLPGWHRGSLGVHGDDGHKYINDRWGGKAFTTPFRRGETLGLGMDFLRGDGGDSGSGIGVQVFLTRNGVETGRWDLHEETDREQDLPVTGLEGYHDVCAAVGVFDEVAFEVVFVPGMWKWKGYQG